MQSTTHDLAALTERYATGYAAVTEAIEGITEIEIDHRAGPGEWTAREIVHHLADAEANASVRLRNLLTDIEYVVAPYDQDLWVASPLLAYGRPIASSLTTLEALREASLELIRRLTPADLARAGVHPEHPEPYSVGLWLQLVADHPHDHAAQILGARRSAAQLGRS